MYQSTIISMGASAPDFLGEQMLILYGANAPAELAEISILHNNANIDFDIETGDSLCIGGEEYIVTAVGAEVNHTFRTMGHCTLRFSGASEAALPGTVELEGRHLPQIKVGGYIQINKGQKEA